MAFGEIYHFAAVFSNRIHKYSLSSQLLAMLKKEQWVIWCSFLCLSLFISVGITWKSCIHRPSENKDMVAQIFEFFIWIIDLIKREESDVYNAYQFFSFSW